MMVTHAPPTTVADEWDTTSNCSQAMRVIVTE